MFSLREMWLASALRSGCEMHELLPALVDCVVEQESVPLLKEALRSLAGRQHFDFVAGVYPQLNLRMATAGLSLAASSWPALERWWAALEELDRATLAASLSPSACHVLWNLGGDDVRWSLLARPDFVADDTDLVSWLNSMQPLSFPRSWRRGPALGGLAGRAASLVGKVDHAVVASIAAAAPSPVDDSAWEALAAQVVAPVTERQAAWTADWHVNFAGIKGAGGYLAAVFAADSELRLAGLRRSMVSSRGRPRSSDHFGVCPVATTALARTCPRDILARDLAQLAAPLWPTTISWLADGMDEDGCRALLAAMVDIGKVRGLPDALRARLDRETVEGIAVEAVEREITSEFRPEVCLAAASLLEPDGVARLAFTATVQVAYLLLRSVPDALPIAFAGVNQSPLATESFLSLVDAWSGSLGELLVAVDLASS